MVKIILSVLLALPVYASEAESIKIWDHEVKNESEVSLVIAKGNTESETNSINEKLSLEKDKNTYTLEAKYLRTKTNDVETGESWQMGLRYEREVYTNFSAFLGYLVERDTYAGYAKRKSIDAGGKYFFIKEKDKENLLAELSIRQTEESDLSNNTDDITYARAYAEWEKKWHKAFSTKLWSEYLHDTDDDKNYRVNSEISIRYALNSILSLKLAYLNKYINQPNDPTIEKMDELYTTSIVAKF